MAKENKTILITVILLLIISNVFFGFKYLTVQKELQQTQTALEAQKTNEKVLDFAKLFIEKVLKAKGEVDFETRLKLENAVREIRDKEILEKWQNFTNSQTEEEAQENVKDLLEILVDKINYSQ